MQFRNTCTPVNVLHSLPLPADTSDLLNLPYWKPLCKRGHFKSTID